MNNSRIICAFCAFWITLLMTFTAPLFAQDTTQSTIIVELQYEPDFPGSAGIQLLCSFGEPRKREWSLNTSENLELAIIDFATSGATCQLWATPEPGYSASYSVSGDAAFTADKNGCQFARFSGGQLNHCQILLKQDPVELMVYKEWIGGSGQEQDVEISLECESGEYSGVRYVNEGSPSGWKISQFDPKGVLCNVTEAARDTFRPDIIDCQGLLVLPGKGEECTLVNTKIVKRIEMLNRYGKIVMIVLVLAVGLVAARRFS